MRISGDRIILLLIGILMSFEFCESNEFVIFCLCGVILCGLINIKENFSGVFFHEKRDTFYRKSNTVLYILCILELLWNSKTCVFSGVVLFTYLYHTFLKRKLEKVEVVVLGLLSLGFFWYFSRDFGYQLGILLLLQDVLAASLARKDAKLNLLEEENRRNRDEAYEMNAYLKEKNQFLAESKKNEIHVATLTERNRIAREIHDNVGHMLSRSILQLGAIMAIHKSEPVYEELVGLKGTLDAAMNNIRESVHDLHNESFDVKNAASQVLEELTDYEVQFECDISMDASKDVKYAFVTILKEAVTNILKHSNATAVNVVMCELEEYYQMVIEDNGKNTSDIRHVGAGIGLQNMEERVRSLSGVITFSNEKGFRIFISIPKRMNKQ